MTAAIILAGGRSRRFGSEPKQLASINGVPMIRKVFDLASAALLDPVVCVLGADSTRIEPELRNWCPNVVINHDWEHGLSSSIATGVDAVIARGDFDAVAILLADQPLVQTHHITRLCDQRESSNVLIAASEYNGGKLGVPAVFDSALFPRLRELSGDRGAAVLIETCAARISIPISFAAALDVDTPSDLAKAIAQAVSTEHDE